MTLLTEKLNLKQIDVSKKIVSEDEYLLSFSRAYRISSDIVYKSWQRHWDNETTGQYTYNLIPSVSSVGIKRHFPK